MKLEDIDEWISNSVISEGDLPIAYRIDSYIKSASFQPKDFQVPMFAGILAKDRDAYAFISKSKPEWRKDLQTAMYGRKWDWGPDQVARLLGFEKPVDMFRRDENGNPAWYNLVSSEDNPSEALDKFYAAEEGLEPDGKLYKWLEAGQKQYDVQAMYTGGALNATRGLFAPRVQESLQRTGDYSKKDVLGDIAENVLLSIPTDRVAANTFIGLKGLGKSTKALAPNAGTKTYKTLLTGSNFVVPAEIELMDRYLYGPNTERGEISPFNIATLGGTNLGVNYALGREAAQIANKTGDMAGKKSGLIGALTSNPLTDYALRLAEEKGPYNVGINSPENKVAEKLLNEIDKRKKLRDVIGDFKFEQMQKMNRWINEADDASIEKYRQKINEIILSDLSPEERRSALISFKYQYPQKMYESDFLPEQMQREYGLTKEGLPAKVAEDFIPINSGKDQGINLWTTPDRSFAALKEEAKQQHETNKVINRESEGDIALSKARSDADLQLKRVGLGGTKSDFIKANLKAVPTSYLKNKVGKSAMSLPVIVEAGEALESHTRNLDPEAQEILKNQAILRMWSDPEKPFVPHKNESDPMYRAWKFWSENLKEK